MGEGRLAAGLTTPEPIQLGREGSDSSLLASPRDCLRRSATRCCAGSGREAARPASGGLVSASLPACAPPLFSGCGVSGEAGSSAVRGTGRGGELGQVGGREGRRDAAVRDSVSATSAAVGRRRGSAATQASYLRGQGSRRGLG